MLAVYVVCVGDLIRTVSLGLSLNGAVGYWRDHNG